MQSRGKLLLIGWRAETVIGWRGIVVYLAERDAVASPSAFEFTIVVVNEYTLCIDDVNLPCLLIQVKKEYSARKRIGLLIVFRWPRPPVGAVRDDRNPRAVFRRP